MIESILEEVFHGVPLLYIFNTFFIKGIFVRANIVK